MSIPHNAITRIQSLCLLERYQVMHGMPYGSRQLPAWHVILGSTLHAGSNVSLTLYFLRFAMGINVAIAAFWLAGTVIPFCISPPSTFSWQYFKAYRPTDLLQGYGLHNTFLLYGRCCCMGMLPCKAILTFISTIMATSVAHASHELSFVVQAAPDPKYIRCMHR